MRSFFDYLCAALELHCARMRYVYGTLLLALMMGGIAVWYFLLLPPSPFPVGTIIEIEENSSLYEVAQELKAGGYIDSEIAFLALMRLTGRENAVQAGPYVFKQPYGLLNVADRLARGVSGVPTVRIRIQEGQTAREIGEQLASKIEGFDIATFDPKARALEGYLFPDTYEILPDETPDEILERFYETFLRRTESIEDEIVAFDHPLRDVLTMASLIEREARGLSEKRMVSGILWNRIELGMPLQVDAVFGYIQDTQTYSPSFDDLEIESPYNTYRNKGLPPGPIANPGVNSILAAVTPTKTEYLYYLTGRDGKMYYAETFEAHKANRARYLD